MRGNHTQTGLTLIGALLLGLAACESTNQVKNAPGALPSAQTDVAPRLNASTYVAHGHLLERQGNFEQAAHQYRQALSLTPESGAARNRLGITLNKLGRHDEATDEFHRAISQDPGAAHLHNNLGFSLYLAGKYAEAEKAFARAVELQPTFRRAHMNRGLVLAQLERNDEALAAFRMAGDEADAYYNLAVVQTQLGQYAEAARMLEQALRADPEFADARQQLREISRLAAAEEAEEAALAEADAQQPESVKPRPQATAPGWADGDAQRGTETWEATLNWPDASLFGPPAELARTDGPIAGPVTVPTRPLVVDPKRADRVFGHIEALLALAEGDWQPPMGGPGATTAVSLGARFDGLVDALLLDAPWQDEVLAQLRFILFGPGDEYGGHQPEPVEELGWRWQSTAVWG